MKEISSKHKLYFFIFLLIVGFALFGIHFNQQNQLELYNKMKQESWENVIRFQNISCLNETRGVNGLC